MDESAFGKRAEACFDVVSPLANPQLKLGAKGQSRLKPAENRRECLVPCHSTLAAPPARCPELITVEVSSGGAAEAATLALALKEAPGCGPRLLR